jgi:hypothetical protein
MSRRWPLEGAELASFLSNDQFKVIVFWTRGSTIGVRDASLFPSSTIILDRLSVSQLASAVARLTPPLSPMILVQCTSPRVEHPSLLLDKRAPQTYLPLGEHHRTSTTT